MTGTIRSATRAVVVHDLDQALAAAAAAAACRRPVLLLSAPDAATFAGPMWFRELVRQAAARHPAAQITAALDCGTAAGAAVAAVAAGLDAIVFQGEATARERLSLLAATHGCVFLPDRPVALDLLGATDPEAACRSWLEAT